MVSRPIEEMHFACAIENSELALPEVKVLALISSRSVPTTNDHLVYLNVFDPDIIVISPNFMPVLVSASPSANPPGSTYVETVGHSVHEATPVPLMLGNIYV